MKELINQILNLWSNYWGDSLFSYLLILAAAYLLVFKRKEENVKYVLTYLLIMLFCFSVLLQLLSFRNALVRAFTGECCG